MCVPSRAMITALGSEDRIAICRNDSKPPNECGLKHSTTRTYNSHSFDFPMALAMRGQRYITYHEWQNHPNEISTGTND